jgi:hypothetical protein
LAFGGTMTMKLGYAYYRSNLIKLAILSVVMPLILWNFFSGKDTKSEPGAIYLLILLWVGGATFLVWQMIRAKRREREAAAQALTAEPGRAANGRQPIGSEKSPTSAAAASHR